MRNALSDVMSLPPLELFWLIHRCGFAAFGDSQQPSASMRPAVYGESGGGKAFLKSTATVQGILPTECHSKFHFTPTGMDIGCGLFQLKQIALLRPALGVLRRHKRFTFCKFTNQCFLTGTERVGVWRKVPFAKLGGEGNHTLAN